MKEISCFPKILVVGRVAWTKDESTLLGIFTDYPADKLAYICIETREPDMEHCHRHFQISEIAMIKRLVRWNIKTGFSVSPNHAAINKNNMRQEEGVLRRVRAHRSFLFLYLREVLWYLGGWKTKELKRFISDFSPDVVFCIGDPLPLMNRLQRHVIEQAGVPAAIFLMDDIYTYTTCRGYIHRLYRWLLRKQVKRNIETCKAHFAISPKMQREYNAIFGINSVLLTKGISKMKTPIKDLHSPIKLLYTGNLLYGRHKTLATIAKAISCINKSGKAQAILHIYTQTHLNTELYKMLQIPGVSELHDPVPHSVLPDIYESSDIVLFVESLEEEFKYIARLSFSTKLTDYLASGRCIFAVGAEDTAPIEYLREADIAVVCTRETEIENNLRQLLENKEMVVRYAENSYDFGIKHHSISLMKERLMETLSGVSGVLHEDSCS